MRIHFTLIESDRTELRDLQQELFGIIRVLEAWHHYLQGSRHPVTILLDHKNLTYFRTAQKLNHQQARWCKDGR
jgi:hypothetical protein